MVVGRYKIKYKFIFIHGSLLANNITRFPPARDFNSCRPEKVASVSSLVKFFLNGGQ